MLGRQDGTYCATHFALPAAFSSTRCATAVRDRAARSACNLYVQISCISANATAAAFYNAFPFSITCRFSCAVPFLYTVPRRFCGLRTHYTRLPCYVYRLRALDHCTVYICYTTARYLHTPFVYYRAVYALPPHYRIPSFTGSFTLYFLPVPVYTYLHTVRVPHTTHPPRLLFTCVYHSGSPLLHTHTLTALHFGFFAYHTPPPHGRFVLLWTVHTHTTVVFDLLPFFTCRYRIPHTTRF